MRVAFSDTAKADLIEIGDYIARDNPQRALTFVQELRSIAEQLAMAPEAWPLVPRHASRGIRRRTSGNYLIFYRLDDDRLIILRVLHGARDYDRLL